MIAFGATEMSPVRIQVVFQGGGAKLCGLMAACEVLQRFHNDKKIEICRVAGSSAGAIAAAMLATCVPIQQFKERIKLVGPRYIKKLRTSSLKGLTNVLRGAPYFSNFQLQGFFKDLFDGMGKFDKISDLNFSPQIYFTDLGTLNARTCASDEYLSVALAKSCRFPFAFSGFSSDDYHVDGGLAMNLPVDELKRDEADKGNVIGVGFEEQPSKLKADNLLLYTQQLFSAAVQSGVARSEAFLGRKNLFKMKLDIETFEFEKCLSEGLTLHYENITYTFEKWLNTWLLQFLSKPSRLERLVRPLVTSTPLHPAVIATLDEKARLDPCVHALNSCHYDVAQLDSAGKFTGIYDCQVSMLFNVTRVARVLQFTFQVGKEGSFDEANLGCGIIDANGRPLAFEAHVDELGSINGSDNHTYRVFFLFKEPLTPTSEGQPYLLEYRYDAADPYPNLGVKADGSWITVWQGPTDSLKIAIAFPREKFGREPKHMDMAVSSQEQFGELGIVEDSFVFVKSNLLPIHDFMNALHLPYSTDKYLLVGREALNVKQGQTAGLVVE